jgi:hypothetical protein
MVGKNSPKKHLCKVLHANDLLNGENRVQLDETLSHRLPQTNKAVSQVVLARFLENNQ